MQGLRRELRWPGSALILVALLFSLLAPSFALARSGSASDFGTICSASGDHADPAEPQHQEDQAAPCGLAGSCCPLPLIALPALPAVALVPLRIETEAVRRGFDPFVQRHRLDQAGVKPRAPPRA
jgi:hypothetical protein